MIKGPVTVNCYRGFNYILFSQDVICSFLFSVCLFLTVNSDSVVPVNVCTKRQWVLKGNPILLKLSEVEMVQLSTCKRSDLLLVFYW